MQAIAEEIFNNQNIFIAIDINGDIYIRGSDIADLLDYKDFKKTLKAIEIDKNFRKKYEDFYTDKKMHPHTLFLHESIIYRLLFRSNKKIANEFQKWLAIEVIPSIRKNGIYELEKKIYIDLKEKFEKKIDEQTNIIKKLTKNLCSEVYEKKQVIYIHIYETYEERPLYKIGYSKNLNKRIKSYGTGKKTPGTIIYYKECYDCKLAEKVLLHKLKYARYEKNKELIDIDFDKLKNIIDITIDELDNEVIKENIDDLIGEDICNEEKHEIKKIIEL